jgi:hypothetical protein
MVLLLFVQNEKTQLVRARILAPLLSTRKQCVTELLGSDPVFLPSWLEIGFRCFFDFGFPFSWSPSSLDSGFSTGTDISNPVGSFSEYMEKRGEYPCFSFILC